MGAALYLPAVYLITSKSQGIVAGTMYLLLIVVSQIVFAFPFVMAYPEQYFKTAFDFGRDFNARSSFNWNFVPQEILVSPYFKNGLLLLHVGLLLYFLFVKWVNLKSIFREIGLYPLRL